MPDNEIIEARRFVLPPIRKPAPAFASPGLVDSAIASTVMLGVLAVSLLALI